MENSSYDFDEKKWASLKKDLKKTTGDTAYKKLKLESGVHRVQRVPTTESQGRIHTSTATVAVLPKSEDMDIQINENDLKYLDLKIRREAFINTINHKLPWEDILIGFQCKVKRYPNIFNANFWYYFSNIYIHIDKRKYISLCNRCDVFTQKIDNLIYHSSQ